MTTNTSPSTSTLPALPPALRRTDDGCDVLIVEDDAELLSTIAESLELAGHTTVTARDGREAAARCEARGFDVVVADVRLPGFDGLELLKHVQRQWPGTKVILMTAFADVAQAVAALKEGAYDYLTKPFELDELLIRLQRICEQRALERELTRVRTQLLAADANGFIVGTSPRIREALARIRAVAQSDAATLIQGESGTGKELAARMLHNLSARRDGPFVAVNCGSLTETLIEAELFGHERGAFTGAERRRDGRFKAADGGTLFLDEVAELSLPAQAKLLRVLQEGTFEPLGSNATIKVDVRVISATHRNLLEWVRDGRFREDLYYRVNVIEIPIPPLRERPGDLAALVQHFLLRFTPVGRSLPALSRSAWEALARHDFPGNVRELSHAVQHAVVLSGGGEIRPEHLPARLLEVSPMAHHAQVMVDSATEERTLGTAVAAFEREYLIRIVRKTGGKRMKAADILGISRKSLWEKMKLHGIDMDGEGRGD
jgi:two-component system response regulator AtoC